MVQLTENVSKITPKFYEIDPWIDEYCNAEVHQGNFCYAEYCTEYYNADGHYDECRNNEFQMLNIEILVVTILGVLYAETSYGCCFATCRNAEFS